jgi:hypothetical protein
MPHKKERQPTTAPHIRKTEYARELHRLQIELVKLHRHVISGGRKLLVILEGRDAAGKDGTIKRIAAHLSLECAETRPSMPDTGHLDALLASKRRMDEALLADSAGARRLIELKAWQAARLARTYEDLQRDPRCAAAVNFFLTDLCGPQNFARRDADFNRAWSRLKRGLPDAALEVLARALELQVLTLELDHAMVTRLMADPLTGPSYANAYRTVGRADARQRQIDLIVGIGTDLNRLVAYPLIGLALRAARLPARIAGFDALQDFLERGFAAFRAMGDATALLEAIRKRETELMRRLFDTAIADPFSCRSTAEGIGCGG